MELSGNEKYKKRFKFYKLLSIHFHYLYVRLCKLLNIKKIHLKIIFAKKYSIR